MPLRETATSGTEVSRRGSLRCTMIFLDSDDVECGLPSTYQTFFQLHLLYVLILLPRLRAIAPNVVARAASTSPAPPTESSASGTASSSTTGMLSKPSNVIYPAEILNHFFDLAETQMRRVLGRGERERVVKKYMEEMGQQWKGSGMAVDYSLGLGLSEDTAERGNADAELAAWLWRNLFDARGSVPLRPSTTDGGDLLSEGASDLDVPKHLEQVVWFMRREMKRLDGIPDEDVLVGNLGTWGPAGLGDQEQAV